MTIRYIGRIFMKSDSLNGLLTFVLGALVVLAVIFAVQTINRSRELNGLQIQAVAINQNYLRLQALVGEVAAYNQKTPNAELTKILQSAR